MQIPSLRMSDFSYELPANKIALEPAHPRDSSKLLHYHKGNISDCIFSDLPELLEPPGLMVFNQSQVIPARLFFKTQSGAKIEIFCLEPLEKKDQWIWKTMVGNLKKWKETEILSSEVSNNGKVFKLYAQLLSEKEGNIVVRFWPGDFLETIDFYDILEAAGHVPLPPYIKRHDRLDDRQNYQTVYAKEKGSVAAPTAGLHFTEKVLNGLKNKQIKQVFITLHVGAGTFAPVKGDNPGSHIMHEEKFSITYENLSELKEFLEKSKLIAVGTTSLRCLESLYWLGVKTHLNGQVLQTTLNQWDPYNLPEELTVPEAFESLLKALEKEKLTQYDGATSVIIVPGYKFKTVNKLVTNFHQPGSTLLLLIAAFLGDKWHQIYQHALQHSYRFLSYGDSSLLEA